MLRGTRLYWWLKYLSGRMPSFEFMMAQPHRQIVCDAVMKLSPKSVLDYGCGNGVNLHLLAHRDPQMSLTGIDPAPHAIKAARKHVDAELLCGTDFGDRTFDVALSDAVFFYLKPDEAVTTLRSLLNASRKAVVFSTWHGIPGRDEETWIHNYNALAESIGAHAAITPYPAGVWSDRRWQKYGAIVTVTR